MAIAFKVTEFIGDLCENHFGSEEKPMDHNLVGNEEMEIT